MMHDVSGLNRRRFLQTAGLAVTGAAQVQTTAKFRGLRTHREVPSVGRNVPQEAPKAFTDAVTALITA